MLAFVVRIEFGKEKNKNRQHQSRALASSHEEGPLVKLPEDEL